MDTTNTQLIEAMFTLSRMMKDQMVLNSTVVCLSFLQLQTLVFLHKNPEIQMSDIAAKFKIELPSATSIINTLAKAKLVSRKADAKDRRLVRITLTKTGENLLKDAMKERTKKMEQYLSQLTKDDKGNLLKILQKMIVTMEKAYEK